MSGFQISFSSADIHTPGDEPDVLVAMNPAALRTNIGDLPAGGALIVNSDAFNAQNLKKAGYETNPLSDGSLSKYNVFEVPISTLNTRSAEGLDLTSKQVDLTKNFFALGMMFWLYERLDGARRCAGSTPSSRRGPPSPKATGARSRPATPLARRPRCSTRPTAWRRPSWTLARTATSPATRRPRSASSWRRKLAKRDLMYGSYPITPASDILHQLATYKNFGVKTFQAEDEIAAIGSAIGASYGGALGMTASSGPGIALKSEALNLAVMVELPLVVVNVQRAGPSTGMPTKTEQADLLMTMFGRNSDSPVAIVAPATPAECFDFAIEAWRIALKYMTPVVYLSDAFLATGSEPWKLPSLDDLPDISVDNATDPRRLLARTRATRRRSPDRGPSRARPASSTASAAWRRPTSPATSAMTPRTTTGCRCCARRRSRASPTTSRRWTSSGRRRAIC